MTLSLKLKHVHYHFLSPCLLLYASLHWLDHFFSSSLLPHHQHSWPLLRITILITSYFLRWLQARQQSSLPSYSISNLKLWTDSIAISFWYPILIFDPSTRNHHSTNPQYHNFHWLQISSLVCTKQPYDTPRTKIVRFGFFPPLWETYLSYSNN